MLVFGTFKFTIHSNGTKYVTFYLLVRYAQKEICEKESRVCLIGLFIASDAGSAFGNGQH